MYYKMLTPFDFFQPFKNAKTILSWQTVQKSKWARFRT